MNDKIKALLEDLRSGLQADGGDLELVKIDGYTVYLSSRAPAGLAHTRK